MLIFIQHSRKVYEFEQVSLILKCCGWSRKVLLKAPKGGPVPAVGDSTLNKTLCVSPLPPHSAPLWGEQHLF